MSAEEASGAYLGGIGTMLEAAEVCTTCGKVHSDRQYAFLHRGSGQCPSLVQSNYLIVSRPEAHVEAHRVPDVAVTDGPEMPVFIGSLPVPPRDADGEPRQRHLGLPLLPPPDLGGIF
jgi:hypothetical protein